MTLPATADLGAEPGGSKALDIPIDGVGGSPMLTAGAADSAEPGRPEPGVVVVLDPVTINLADGHYLKLAMTLQATADVAEEPDGSKALDIAIDEFGELEMGDLSSSV